MKINLNGIHYIIIFNTITLLFSLLFSIPDFVFVMFMVNLLILIDLVSEFFVEDKNE